MDEQALAIAINDEKIGGAALDVFGNEPLEYGSPLLAADPDRLILTPHNASSSVESRVGNVRVATENVLQVLQGKIPENAVNPEIAARWRGRPLFLVDHRVAKRGSRRMPVAQYLRLRESLRFRSCL